MYLGLSPAPLSIDRTGIYNGLLRGFTRGLAFPGLNFVLLPHTIPAPAAPVSRSTPPRSSSPQPGLCSSASDIPHSKKAAAIPHSPFRSPAKPLPKPPAASPPKQTGIQTIAGYPDSASCSFTAASAVSSIIAAVTPLPASKPMAIGKRYPLTDSCDGI